MQPLDLKFFDSHVHLLDYPAELLPQILYEAKLAGVDTVVCNTTCEAQYPKLQSLCLAQNPVNIVKSFGIHPYKVSTTTQGWLARLQAKLQQNPHHLVGQIGLDFRDHIMEQNPKETQLDFFHRQFQLGCLYNRPMSIHCVRAYGDILKYFKKIAKAKEPEIIPNLIMHSYNGSREVTESLVKLAPRVNVYFSLALKRNEELCEVIPVERLLLETDGPYQLNKEQVQKNGVKLAREGVNELRFLGGNGRLGERYGMAAGEFVAQVWRNSMKAFKMLI